MWNNLIFIDYDVGAFGNTILALLVTTSQSAADSIPYQHVFSPNGDSHKIRKLYKYSNFEYNICTKSTAFIPDIKYENISKTQYIPIIGHSYMEIDMLMDRYPDANLIRIYPTRRSFSTQFLAGCKKYQGFPTVENMDIFYDKSWENFNHTNLGLIECLAVNFFKSFENVDTKFYPNAITIPLDKIIDTTFDVIIKLFETHFNFVFDYVLVKDFVKKWQTANKEYIDRSNIFEKIVYAINNNCILNIENMQLRNYEQSLIIAMLAYDCEIDIFQFPFNDCFNLDWKTTEQLGQFINYLKTNKGK